MTAQAPESTVIEGVRSLEARWIFPGQLETAVAAWLELTEFRTRGQDWWTLGFEATGPADVLHSALQATAALVFAQALPGSVEPGLDESGSYMEWLCQRPGAERYADA